MATYGKTFDQRALSAGLDTGRAKLPALPKVKAGDPALQSWMDKVAERLEVREGARGNDAERVVTQREFSAIANSVDALKNIRDPGDGRVALPLGGGLTATIAIEQFGELIRKTRLYRDLIKRLDDPSRFDAFPQEIRDMIVRSVADEAARLGAAITSVQSMATSQYRSLVSQMDTLTSAVAGASAGIRNTQFVVAETHQAQAAIVTQLEASLGNYYQDGTPGRASLEQSMVVTADRVTGLESQYTLKVQAGGAVAGFGIAATEVNNVPSSAFIITADKFAIVSPGYNGGLTNSPDPNTIPFGVDANGIYMNTNVYVRGNMRVDTGGKTLIDGLRGSLSANAGTGAWSDVAARSAIWQALGKTGTPTTNNHLVIGDSVTMGDGSTTITKHWMGDHWEVPGLVFNGNLLVNGSLSASKIDSQSLTIRDKNGNIIFGSGAGANWFTQLGRIAVQDTVDITGSSTTSMVTVNGQKLRTQDFVNALSKISSGNISNFMESAAIGNAYIGNLAVSTLNIQDNAVTVPQVLTWSHMQTGVGILNWITYATASLYMDASGVVVITGVIHTGTDGTGWAEIGSRMLVNGMQVSMRAIDSGYYMDVHAYKLAASVGQTVTVALQWYGATSSMRAVRASITMLGVKK